MEAPVLVRLTLDVVVSAALGGAVGALVLESPAGVIGFAVGGVALVVGTELVPWGRQLMVERTGWTGDPDELKLVEADVDSGRVPEDTPDLRELARRYARERLERMPARGLTVGLSAVMLALALVGLVSGPMWLSVLTLLGLLPVQVDVWLKRPRYERVEQRLGHDEAAWARRLGRTRAEVPASFVPPRS